MRRNNSRQSTLSVITPLQRRLSASLGIFPTLPLHRRWQAQRPDVWAALLIDGLVYERAVSSTCACFNASIPAQKEARFGLK